MWINYNSKIAPKNKYTSAKSEIAILFWYPHARFEQSWEDILYTGSVSFLSPGGFHGQEATLGLTVEQMCRLGWLTPHFLCAFPLPPPGWSVRCEPGSSYLAQLWPGAIWAKNFSIHHPGKWENATLYRALLSAVWIPVESISHRELPIETTVGRGPNREV